MIYTKTGDKGETSLANGQRVSKTDARIEAYGTVDELNSAVGLLRARLKQSAVPVSHSDEELHWVQNKLFNLGAALSCAPGDWITDVDVRQVETWIDSMQAEVPKQRAFVLPSGSVAVAECHVCRTICRRAERRMIGLGWLDVELRFINRISDYLFVLARYIAFVNGEQEENWEQR